MRWWVRSYSGFSKMNLSLWWFCWDCNNVSLADFVRCFSLQFSFYNFVICDPTIREP